MTSLIVSLMTSLHKYVGSRLMASDCAIEVASTSMHAL